MSIPDKPYPRVRAMKFGRFKNDPSTVVLTIADNEDGEYRVGVAANDAGHLIGGLIASVGQTLDVDRIRSGKMELSTTKVVVANAGIGFGDTAKGPVLVAEVGGLTLVFTISEWDLVEMAQQILDDFDEAGASNSSARSH